jgi:hypothetical protein
MSRHIGCQADVRDGHAWSHIYLSKPDQLVPKDSTSKITGLKSGIPTEHISYFHRSTPPIPCI